MGRTMLEIVVKSKVGILNVGLHRQKSLDVKSRIQVIASRGTETDIQVKRCALHTVQSHCQGKILLAAELHEG